jgi:4-amino-4-deoxy-L-arabinose transferase-like glycosyltransferase
LPGQIGAVLFVAALLGLYLWHGLSRRADPDEFQTLVNAVLSARGLRLYADYWDNHGPLMTWILNPLVGAWVGGYDLIRWLRGAMWINVMAVAGLVFALARGTDGTQQGEKHKSSAPLIAITMLLLSPPFLAKSIELRSDNPANLVGICSLLLLYRALKTGRLIHFLMAGAGLGIMAGFTLKAGMYLVALGGFAAVFSRKAARPLRLPEVAFFLLGLIGPLLVITAAMLYNGTFSPFLRCYLAENLQRDFPGFTSSELTEIFQKSPMWSCVALGVLVTSLWRGITRKDAPAEAALAVMTLTLLLEFALLLPTKYYQSLLPAFPPLAVLTGLLMERAWEHVGFKSRTLAFTLAAVTGVLLLADLARFNDLQNTGLQRQIRFSTMAADALPQQGQVFDPSGILYFAPRAGYYPVLVKYVRRAQGRGLLEAGIAAQLEQAAALVMDKRTKDLPQADLDYISAHFSQRITGGGAELWLRN